MAIATNIEPSGRLSKRLAVEAEALAYLRRESLDVYNRLHSIDEDVQFIIQVKEAYPQLPIVPNLRCGAWYVNPDLAVGEPAYFKSTDGHYNGWSFNLRRPNLHLLPIAIASHGMIIVDSTRSGKRLPDALSKTVPIWCAVINRAQAFRQQRSGDGSGLDWTLYTPPTTVSAQEHSQIEGRLDQWALNLANSSYILPDIPRSLRPFWITPATSLFPSFSPDADFIPIICVSASKQVHDGIERRSLGFAYVQGSGDDHELWGTGLTPQLFWQHRCKLLAAQRLDLRDYIATIIAQVPKTPPNPSRGWCTKLTAVSKVNGRIKLCRLEDLSSDFQGYLPERTSLILLHRSSSELAPNSERVLRLSVPEGKKGQHMFLHQILPRVLRFASTRWQKGQDDVAIACHDGKDTSVGVALALLQAWFDDEGALRTEASFDSATKQSIRTRLEWVIASQPVANPSRATLKRVNDFALSGIYAPYKCAARVSAEIAEQSTIEA